MAQTHEKLAVEIQLFCDCAMQNTVIDILSLTLTKSPANVRGSFAPALGLDPVELPSCGAMRRVKAC